MPTLRAYEESFLTALKNQGIKFTDYDRTEMMYPENKLNNPVNAIALEIPAIYQNICLT